jgi:nucleoside-diphosphate-sugar epimerase
MRVLVTGGNGKLGRAVVSELIDHGHEVWVCDRVLRPESPVRQSRVELTDYGQALEVISERGAMWPGTDAVVHLAAIAAVGEATESRLFANNVIASFNVFQAARHAGIRNVVWASSETLLGTPHEVPPPYLPVDEEYPPRPNGIYPLVKDLEEEMALQMCRWDAALKMVGLRFSNIMAGSDYDKLASYHADPALRRRGLWAYIDTRDGAQAVRLALEWQATGRHIFVISNSDSVMDRPTPSLVARFFPDVPLKRPVGEFESLQSSDKAKRILGYEPRHSWRTSPRD